MGSKYTLKRTKSGACPEIRKGRGGPKSESFLFFFWGGGVQYFRGGGVVQKIGEKMIFPTKKVAKPR